MSPGSPVDPAVISGGAGAGWYSAGCPRRLAGWGKGDPNEKGPRPPPHNTRPARVGYSGRGWKPGGPPGARLTFLEGAGVKGVEEVGVGWGEPPRAGRRQVLAQRWTARNAAGKLALRPARRPGLRTARPVEGGSPGFPGPGLSPSSSTERGGRTAVQTAARGFFCSFIFNLRLALN